MAKKKRRAASSKKGGGQAATKEREAPAEADSMQAAIERLIGQWNQLVSTTNWEKGSIICQWRDELMTGGAPVTDYSDEAWAQLVGSVTGQHVGRLRRVYQRFGETYDQYEGLFWSHFQAALDWEDAEMWLEGAIHNDWSISQMRGKRWETLGTPPEQQQSELESEQEVSEHDFFEESADSGDSQPPTAAGDPPSVKPVATEITAEPADAVVEEADDPEPAKPVKQKRTALKIDVDHLPDDLAEAFESFKLAIIAHRREGWSETTPDVVFGCLDALRELTTVED